MDLQTLYFKAISAMFTWLTVPLFPLCILTLFIKPPERTKSFPPPPGHKEPREVSVPLFPPFLELFSMFVALLAEIALLCPYLRDDGTKPKFSQYWGFPLFAYHFVRAKGLAGMETNWSSAQKRYGLWHLKLWKAYYLVHIFMGLAVGYPLLFRFVTYVGIAIYQVAPIVYWALRTAYGPLN